MPRPHQVPENEGVLRYLGQGLAPDQVEVRPPPPNVDTWRLGAHPDIVERLWRDLNAVLPQDARFLVAGGAALIAPESGQILALALGTQYALRLAGDGLATAQANGYASVHSFRTVERTLDLAREFGPGWVFGQYDDREADWLRESYRATAP